MVFILFNKVFIIKNFINMCSELCYMLCGLNIKIKI